MILRVLVLILAVLSAPALALEIETRTSQGGLIFGTAEPGTKLTLGDRAVRVAPDGRFVIGFGRDHGPEARLKAVLPDGTLMEKTIAVAPRDYQIQRIDGLPPKMVTPPEDVLARIRRENGEIAEARKIDRPEASFASGWIWPTEGIITGVYGSQRVLNGEPRRPHYGIDIAAPTGTPVLAPSAGVVTLAETDLYYTGGTVILDHGHGLTSAFLHMEVVEVSVGDRLEKGQRFGTVGSTGRSTGAHLDWRINWFNQRVDPAFLVPPMQ